MMDFDVANYLIESSNDDYFPQSYFPAIEISKTNYNELEKKHTANNNTIKDAFNALHMRVGDEYYFKVYPAQTSALYLSQKSFTAYKFLLPEVIADDWLSIVGWHKRYSRDHAFHQPLTAYIVRKLLGGGDGKKSLQIGESNLLDICVDKIMNGDKTEYLIEYLLQLGLKNDHKIFKKTQLGREYWKSIFYETAIISALFHDIGYPWQYINLLTSNLSSATFSSVSPIQDTEQLLRSFGSRLILYPLNGYRPINNSVPSNWKHNLKHLISQSLTGTHGFPGAIGYIMLNDITRKYPLSKKSAIYQFCIDWASMGIMMHDMKGIYHGSKENNIPDNFHMRLEIDRDPLSCIVTLADVLEEFERPSVLLNKKDHGSEFKYTSMCEKTSIDIIKNELVIKYKYQTSAAAIEKRVFMKNELKEYFHPEFGYLDLTSIGIRKVTMVAEY